MAKPDFGGAYAAPRRQVEPLRMCWGCRQYVQPRDVECPHCGADVDEEERAYMAKLDEVLKWKARLEEILARAKKPATKAKKKTKPRVTTKKRVARRKS